MHGAPLWDDDVHITAPALRTWAGLRRIWCDFRATQQYYPITHSLFWVEHRLFGDGTLGYHLLNVCLHLMTALLFWRLLVRLQVPGARLAAALFALHPVNVESVAWISELKNTLSGMFCLSAALIYLHFDQARTKRHYALAFALFVLGLGSKSVIATLPAALIVIFWWKRGRLSLSRDLLPLLPFLCIGIASGLFTAWVERSFLGAVGREYRLTLVQRVLIAGRALWFYLGKLLWPAKLIFIYPRWRVSQRVWWQYLYPAGVVLTAGALWPLRSRWRAPLAVFLLYAGTLAPVLGFLNIYPFRYSFVADHFQYLATLPIFAAIGSAIALLLERLPPAGRWAGQAAAVLLLAGLGLLSWRQSRFYRDPLTLYNAAIRDNPTCWLAYVNRGCLYNSGGRTAEALADWSRAIRLEPAYPEAYTNRGYAYQAMGRYYQALADYDQAIRLKPDYPEAFNSRGNAYQFIGQSEMAIADYNEAIRLRPDYVEAYTDRSSAYHFIGSDDQAIADLGQAIRLRPDYAEAYYNRGNAYQSIGQSDLAVVDFDQAIRLQPAFASAYNNRALARHVMGRDELAIADYDRAIRLKPDYAEAHYNLALSHFAVADYARALADIQQFRRLGGVPNPEFVKQLTQALGRSE